MLICSYKGNKQLTDKPLDQKLHYQTKFGKALHSKTQSKNRTKIQQY